LRMQKAAGYCFLPWRKAGLLRLKLPAEGFECQLVFSLGSSPNSRDRI
jgi:hypothetical protein